MFGRNASFALLLLAFASTQAHARTQNFATSPFGIGLLGGVENRPRSGFVTGTQTTSSNYTSYVGFEPFVDLVNVSFRAHFDWHFYPILNGSGGADSHGAFTDSSDAGSFGYGVRAQLAPFVGRDGRSRAFFMIGVIQTLVRIKNTRKYTTGTLAGKTFSEQLQGTGSELSGGVGYEFYFLQNWSLQLEAGYTSLSVSDVQYRTTTDLTGATVSTGATAKDSAGNDMGFHVWSPYGQVVLNLNL